MKRAVLVLTLMLLLSSATTSKASTIGAPTSNFWANSGKTISTEPQPTDNSALVENILVVIAIAIPNLLKT